MDLISRQDAIKTVRKTILKLMDGLPTIVIEGEECYADNKLCNAYLEANKAVSNALRKIPSWHTDDPEESGEYLVTWEGKNVGKRFIGIAEFQIEEEWNDTEDWLVGIWNVNDIEELGYHDVDVVAWMPLPDAFEGEV